MAQDKEDAYKEYLKRIPKVLYFVDANCKVQEVEVTSKAFVGKGCLEVIFKGGRYVYEPMGRAAARYWGKAYDFIGMRDQRYWFFRNDAEEEAAREKVKRVMEDERDRVWKAYTAAHKACARLVFDFTGR